MCLILYRLKIPSNSTFSLFSYFGGLLMFHKIVKSQQGFTIVELLTVLIIISVLTTISIVAYGGAKHRARLARIKTNVGEIAIALDNYQMDKNGKYPALTVYHNTLPPTDPPRLFGYTTTPNPPSDPIPGIPVIVKRLGNAIIGGGPPLVDTGNPLQDDFYRDTNPLDVSFFRNRQQEVQWGGDPDDFTGAMNPVDQLARNGQLNAYPHNPLAGPGIPMVNIAHILYEYDTQTNDFSFVEFTVTATGETRMGLCAARPVAGGFYEPIDIIWNEDTYPQGDFAYIPMEFTSEQGTYCSGYWIISYGDLSTLENSDYNKFALNKDLYEYDSNYSNWPNLPWPYGDGIASTPPALNSVEYEIKRLVQGALDIRATIFEDQLRESFF